MLVHAHEEIVLLECLRDFESAGRVHIRRHHGNSLVRLLRVSEDILSLENYLKITLKIVTFLAG
jgi:hypothetical protein